MYNDQDLVSRAMQPYQRLLHQATNERLIRCLRSQQRRPKTASQWMAALGDRLVCAGQFLRLAAQTRETNRLTEGCCSEVATRRMI